jgi:hypothetical protein
MYLSGGRFNAWASHAKQPVGTWIWHAGWLLSGRGEAATFSGMSTVLAASNNGILSSYLLLYAVKETES